MRYRVSKCIPNRHAGPLLPPHLSYWRDDTPSVAVLPTHFAISVVPHLFCCRIHPCCPPSLLTCSSAAAFAVDLVCHPHYPASPPHLFCHTPESLLRSSSHYLPSSHVICRRFLSTFSVRIFVLLWIVLYCTACSALLHTTFLTLRSDLLNNFFFSLLLRLFSLSVIFSLRSDLPRFFSTCLHCAMLQSDHSPQLCLIQSNFFISDMLNSYFSSHRMIWCLRSALIS